MLARGGLFMFLFSCSFSLKTAAKATFFIAVNRFLCKIFLFIPIRFTLIFANRKGVRDAKSVLDENIVMGHIAAPPQQLINCLGLVLATGLYHPSYNTLY